MTKQQRQEVEARAAMADAMRDADAETDAIQSETDALAALGISAASKRADAPTATSKASGGTSHAATASASLGTFRPVMFTNARHLASAITTLGGQSVNPSSQSGGQRVLVLRDASGALAYMSVGEAWPMRDALGGISALQMAAARGRASGVFAPSGVKQGQYRP